MLGRHAGRLGLVIGVCIAGGCGGIGKATPDARMIDQGRGMGGGEPVACNGALMVGIALPLEETGVRPGAVTLGDLNGATVDWTWSSRARAHGERAAPGYRGTSGGIDE